MMNNDDKVKSKSLDMLTPEYYEKTVLKNPITPTDITSIPKANDTNLIDSLCTPFSINPITIPPKKKNKKQNNAVNITNKDDVHDAEDWDRITNKEDELKKCFPKTEEYEIHTNRVTPKSIEKLNKITDDWYIDTKENHICIHINIEVRK